jgi:hypothetical protein
MEGRSDKKFCGDQCRASHNNAQRSQSERLIMEVNKVLRKNRTLLKQLNPTGMSIIRKEFLSQNGFNFNYFTSRYKTRDGNEYWFCYDIGWMYLEDEKIRIIEYQSYMKKS